jgi:V8-like Glu-specific endopeptidase
VKTLLNLILAFIIGIAIGEIILSGYRYLHPPLVTKAYSHIADKLSPVVRLTNQAGQTFCSGVVVSPHTIITAAHCVIIASIFGIPLVNNEIYIRDIDANPPGIKATVTSVRPQLDTATMTGEFGDFESRAVITNIDKLVDVAQPGAVFTSCGYPIGGPIYCSKIVYQGRFNFAWLMKGELLPGMSGGPMMMNDGTVIAINDAVEDDFSIVVPLYNTPILP